MPVFQLAWIYYLNNSALVLNCLALFYALSGSWLILATQLRSARAARLLASSAGLVDDIPSPAALRINRLFMRIAGVCLALALLLTLAASLV